MQQPAALHPELRPMLPMLRVFQVSLANLRFTRWMSRLMPTPAIPAGVTVADQRIPGPAGAPPVRVRVYRPAALQAPAAAMVWIHGGGYVIGRVEQDEAYCAEHALALGMLVVSVEYRLAPEQPFPAGLEDCYAALRWVHNQAGALGVDPLRIALGGSSAGGGLAAALAQLAADRGEVRPAFQALLYPMLDDRTVTRPGIEQANTLVWTPRLNRLGWTSYLGCAPGSGQVPPYAVPARRADLSNLPPAWIGVGSLDLFYEEDLDYARRLRAAGVPCALHVAEGAYHGFDQIAAKTSIARAFKVSRLTAMKQALKIEGKDIR